ncbi:hypothetical protein GCM10009665_77440 [Kitasatospora nipponensis]|uniref:Uncharacterized protein n=1 Tax=Kitasatospora nipponensis TaxID=258049 RepID=A0ABN1T9C7_9ACTN
MTRPGRVRAATVRRRRDRATSEDGAAPARRALAARPTGAGASGDAGEAGSG